MAITKCKECKKEVSSSAKVCPHCGIKDPGVGAKEAIWGFIIVLVITGFIWSSCTLDDSENTTANTQKTNFKYVSKKHFPKTWPLTVDGGSIRCVGSFDAVLFLANKKTYALNGAGYNYAEENGISITEIKNIWAEDKSLSFIKGKDFTPKMDLSPLTDFGVTLCKT